MSRIRWIGYFALIVAVYFSGCRSEQRTPPSPHGSGSTYNTPIAGSVDLLLPSGMSIDVRLDTKLTSDGTQVGDEWAGEVMKPVILDGKTLAPAGSLAGGTVTDVGPACSGDLSMLRLGLTSLTVRDRNYRVKNSTEATVGDDAATGVALQIDGRLVLEHGTPLIFTVSEVVAVRP